MERPVDTPAAGDRTLAAPPPAPTVVVTRMRFAAAPAQVWNALMFYEQIEEPPPIYLRWLLPRPLGTEGPKAEVGDEARCLYSSGHLVKRVTRIDLHRHYGFDVVEQALAIGGGVRLSGGGYTLREVPGAGTDVTVTTRYLGGRRPGWLWKPVEAAVCHLFHRHLLSAIRRGVGPRPDGSGTRSHG
jgi:hypothetical protein